MLRVIIRRRGAVVAELRKWAFGIRARTAVHAFLWLRFNAIAVPVRDETASALLRQKDTVTVAIFCITILAYENKIATPVGVGFITLPAS